MSSLTECPNCNRTAKDSMFSNYFPVYTCLDCGKKYCKECGKGDGKTCPDCGSKKYAEYDRVYF